MRLPAGRAASGPLAGDALIALGSNLADPAAQLRQAVRALGELGSVRGVSGVYRTVPVGGPAGQPAYLNAVLALSPRAPYDDPGLLLAALLEAERRQGRERRQRWAARTLDLDLLAYGDRVLQGPDLVLPHPRMMERAFVLAPLCELAPAWRHPITGEGACDALSRLPQGGVERLEAGLGMEDGG
ncbi:MAG TPA: 2-amino-4-hydroxy-6-hydroxymethyldihydropteridine diphosphokinase [Trueperaceae bacterium]